MDRGFSALIALIVVVVLGLVGFWFLRTGDESGKKVSIGNTPISRDVISSPSPFPFWELTIPYLSSREYTSKLGELDEIFANSVYTSYLTNYDSDGIRVDGYLTIPAGEMPEGGCGNCICPWLYPAKRVSNNTKLCYLRRLFGGKRFCGF